MILKLLNKVFNRKSSHYESAAQPIVISRQHHGIQRLQIAPCALKIITQLQQAGYSSYIVGGAARDLLFGFTPKDYAVATNATPEQIRRIFRRSRIIGRRFRLVHVMCGSDIIEVSTFRGSSKIDDAAQTDPHGRLLRQCIRHSREDAAT
jgi:poly(A) polymerase